MGKIAIDFKSGSIKQNESVVIGIDLGTTNSLVACTVDGKTTVLKDEKNQQVLVPSIIYIDKNQNIVIGEEAKQQLVTNPDATIYSVKRLIGKSYQDISESEKLNSVYNRQTGDEQEIRLKLRDRTYTPVELSSMILSYLKSRAESRLHCQITQAVITVPAYFNDAQRQATRDAGKLAGLDVLRIVNEPTAASLAYGIGLDPHEIKTVAVYDLGGGTFDISILRIEGGVFDVLSTSGDTMLGGDDIDHDLVHYIENKFGIEPSKNLQERNARKLEAEKIKKGISEQLIPQSGNFADETIEISVDELELVTKPWVEKTIKCCKQAIKDSGLTIKDIDEVLLVGGSTRLIPVRQAVKSFFGKEPNTSLHPDEAVALGAAVQADILSGKRKDLLLLDVTPLSLGIETLGGLMDVIIPRNSKIPISQARNYSTSKDGQTKLKISVFQGERNLVEDNRNLAEFTMQNIPPMAAGIPKIEVSFLINADGILTVKAKELRSNTEQSIVIKSQFAVSQSEVANMLLDSIYHAREDMEKKKLIDLVNEASHLILNGNKFLKTNQNELSKEESKTIGDLVFGLNSAIQNGDPAAIQTAIDQFNSQTAGIAYKMMDLQIGKSLSGKEIN